MTYYKSRLPASNVIPAWSTDAIPEFQDKLLAAVASQSIALMTVRGESYRRSLIGTSFLGRTSNQRRQLTPPEESWAVCETLRASLLNEDVWSVRRSEVDGLIEKFLAKQNNFELRRVGAGPPDIDPCALQPRISVIADLLGDFVAGRDYADAAFDAYKGRKFFRPGGAWDDFICALAKYYQGELRGDVHASKRGKASAFPRFAFAIQCTLPKRFWNHSEDSAKDPPAEGDPPQAFSHAVDKVLRQHNLRRPSKGPR